MVINQCHWDTATQVFYLSGTDEEGHMRMFGIPRETIEDVVGWAEWPHYGGEVVEDFHAACRALAEQFPHDRFIMITTELWPGDSRHQETLRIRR